MLVKTSNDEEIYFPDNVSLPSVEMAVRAYETSKTAIPSTFFDRINSPVPTLAMGANITKQAFSEGNEFRNRDPFDPEIEQSMERYGSIKSPMNYVQQLVGHFREGVSNLDSSNLGASQLFKPVRDADYLDKSKQIEAKWPERKDIVKPAFDLEKDILGSLQTISFSVAEQSPYLGAIGIKRGIGYALGFGAGLTIGKNPAFAIKSAKIVATVATFQEAFDLEAGSIYHDVTTRYKVSHDNARTAAIIGGAFNAAAEEVGWRILGKTYTNLVGKKNLNAMVIQVAQKSPELRDRLLKTAGKFMGGVAQEVGIEDLQELSSIIAEFGARISELPDGIKLESLGSEKAKELGLDFETVKSQTWERLKQTTIESLKTFPVIMLPGGVADIRSDFQLQRKLSQLSGSLTLDEQDVYRQGLILEQREQLNDARVRLKTLFSERSTADVDLAEQNSLIEEYGDVSNSSDEQLNTLAEQRAEKFLSAEVAISEATNLIAVNALLNSPNMTATNAMLLATKVVQTESMKVLNSLDNTQIEELNSYFTEENKAQKPSDLLASNKTLTQELINRLRSSVNNGPYESKKTFEAPTVPEAPKAPEAPKVIETVSQKPSMMEMWKQHLQDEMNRIKTQSFESPERRGKKAKAFALKNSVFTRAMEGRSTPIEIKNEIKELESMTVGKEVSDKTGKKYKILRNPAFGKVLVENAAGNKINLNTNEVITKTYTSAEAQESLREKAKKEIERILNLYNKDYREKGEPAEQVAKAPETPKAPKAPEAPAVEGGAGGGGGVITVTEPAPEGGKRTAVSKAMEKQYPQLGNRLQGSIYTPSTNEEGTARAKEFIQSSPKESARIALGLATTGNYALDNYIRIEWAKNEVEKGNYDTAALSISTRGRMQSEAAQGIQSEVTRSSFDTHMLALEKIKEQQAGKGVVENVKNSAKKLKDDIDKTKISKQEVFDFLDDLSC